MKKTFIEAQHDPTGKPTGKIIMSDHLGFREIVIDQPILSFAGTVDAARDIDREPTISLLLEINEETVWVDYKAYHVCLVIDRINEHGYKDSFWAS